jgi:mono/diheme cytochrome c family protein
VRRALLAGAALLAVVGCRQDMHDQPRYEPYERSAFFADGMASRPLPAGVVARGHLREDTLFYTGKLADGTLTGELPAAVDAGVLRRGQERFDIFCSPCHGRLGDGQGMAARRGFKQPPSLHLQRLRDQPVGYYFDVMSSGFGVMPSYAAVVPAADRWAIAAYIRALQRSQHAEAAHLSADDHQALDALPEAAPGHLPTAQAGSPPAAGEPAPAAAAPGAAPTTTPAH